MSVRTVLDRIHMPECPRWRDDTPWLTDIWVTYCSGWLGGHG
jgi:hypothetical protein